MLRAATILALVGILVSLFLAVARRNRPPQKSTAPASPAQVAQLEAETAAITFLESEPGEFGTPFISKWNGRVAWVIADQTLFELYRALRNPSVFGRPLGAAAAVRLVEQIRDQGAAAHCAYDAGHWPKVMDVLRRFPDRKGMQSWWPSGTQCNSLGTPQAGLRGSSH